MEENGITAKETVPASRKLGEADAAEFAKAATKVVIAKGKSFTEYRPGSDSMSEIVPAMLGPTGNLRAPTLKKGKTVVVGFHEDVYENLFRS